MNEFMKKAIEEAYEGIKNGHGGPFGAVVVKDGKIIASGHNMVIAENDPTMHGEIAAIRKAAKAVESFDLSGCEIYTTGQPCPMCLAAIMWANIDKVYYGADSGDIEDIGFRDSKFYDIINSGNVNFLEQTDKKQCLELFDAYKNIKDKKNY